MDRSAKSVPTAAATDALAWMSAKEYSQKGRFLFRGQNRIWPTVKASITRDGESTRNDLWLICGRFTAYPDVLTGYPIRDVFDRRAALQHYVGRAPVIDLTGTPEIALYFALLDAQRDAPSVVYSIDRTVAETPKVVFTDHGFLALPFAEGGNRHRWLRQDGYTVGPADWKNAVTVQEFDFLKLPGVESFAFQSGKADSHLVEHLGDLEDVDSDPLASRVRELIETIALNEKIESPELRGILRNSKTRSPHDARREEIQKLIDLAERYGGDANLLNTLRSLLDATDTTIWDSSFECSLDWARNEVKKLTKASD